MMGQSFANGASLLGPQVQGNVLLALVKLSQVLLLFLVHDDVDPGDRFLNDSNLGQLGSGASSHLGNPEASQFSLEVLKLLGQLFLFLGSKLGALDSGHFKFYSKI